jgi:hypothetical protein
MHSLLPDKVEVFDSQKDKLIAVKDLSEIIFENGTAVNTSVPLQDLFFSLGVGHAGGHSVVAESCLQANQALFWGEGVPMSSPSGADEHRHPPHLHVMTACL